MRKSFLGDARFKDASSPYVVYVCINMKNGIYNVAQYRRAVY